MKKAKFALTAVAVLAIVGGALASKAKGNNLICYIFDGHIGGNCSVQALVFDRVTVLTPTSLAFCDPNFHTGPCTNPVVFNFQN